MLSFQTIGELTNETEAGFPVDCLHSAPPYQDVPSQVLEWINQTGRTVVFFNSAEAALPAADYCPPAIRLYDVIHGLVPYQYRGALRYEKHLNGIVAVSHATADAFRRRLIDDSKVYVVHNGLSLSSDEATRYENRSSIAFLGGSASNKGAHDILAVWPRLLDGGFDGKLQWLGTIEPEFRTKIDRLPARDQIVLQGQRSRDDVLQILAGSESVLVLSRSESFGLVVLEALAMGAIPILYRMPKSGTLEVVGSDYPFLARAGGLSDVVNKVLEVRKWQAAEKKKLAAPILSRFTEGAMWSGYERLLKIDASAGVVRSSVGEVPPPYRPAPRAADLLPMPLKNWLNDALAKWPRAYRFLREQFS
jgi:glycosyltransferase involved in cell wall biosynthesis